MNFAIKYTNNTLESYNEFISGSLLAKKYDALLLYSIYFEDLQHSRK